MTVLSGDPVAVILAAGQGERLGHDKLFEPVGDQAVIERVIHAHMHAAKVEDVVVVIPPRRMGDFSWLRSVRVHLVENPAASEGMITSIRAALRTTWVAGRDFLLCPADMPFVPTEVINKVVQTFLARPCRIVIPTYKGLGGHPTLFARSLKDEFFLHGDQHGTREILRRYRDETMRVNVHDPDVCFDIDTPEDLRIAADAGARWARVESMVEDKKRHRLG